MTGLASNLHLLYISKTETIKIINTVTKSKSGISKKETIWGNKEL